MKMESQASCFSCKKLLKGEWEISDSDNDDSNSYGRFVGVEGFLVTTLKKSDQNRPGWVTAYCKSCWEAGILDHPIVKAKLDEAAKKVRAMEARLSNESLKGLEKQDKIIKLEREFAKMNLESLKYNFELKIETLTTERNQLKTTIQNMKVFTRTFGTSCVTQQKEIFRLKQRIVELEAEINKIISDECLKAVEKETERKSLKGILVHVKDGELEQLKSRVKLLEEEREHWRVQVQNIDAFMRISEISSKIQQAEILRLENEIINLANEIENPLRESCEDKFTRNHRTTLEKTKANGFPADVSEERDKMRGKMQNIEHEKQAFEENLEKYIKAQQVEFLQNKKGSH